MPSITNRTFERNPGRAKRAARREPVIITHHGRPAFVLTRCDRYRNPKTKRPSMFDLFWDGTAGDFEFDPPRFRDGMREPSLVDLVRQDDEAADFDFEPPRHFSSTPGNPEGLP